jgi:hypothetical protein
LRKISKFHTLTNTNYKQFFICNYIIMQRISKKRVRNNRGQLRSRKRLRGGGSWGSSFKAKFIQLKDGAKSFGKRAIDKMKQTIHTLKKSQTNVPGNNKSGTVAGNNKAGNNKAGTAANKAAAGNNNKGVPAVAAGNNNSGKTNGKAGAVAANNGTPGNKAANKAAAGTAAGNNGNNGTAAANKAGNKGKAAPGNNANKTAVNSNPAVAANASKAANKPAAGNGKPAATNL